MLDILETLFHLIILIGFIILVIFSFKWIAKNIETPCNEFTENEFKAGNIPFRCLGVWKEKE